MLEWKENITDTDWDKLLSEMNGHLLQSSVWGNARKTVDGIRDARWGVFRDGAPVYLARFEERRVFKKIKIAWVPQGPVYANQNDFAALHCEFLKRLRSCGYLCCFTSRYQEVPEENNTSHSHTIWIDLQLGLDQLSSNLNKQFRYDVRRAKKLGVIVKSTKNVADIREFYNTCKKLSIHKGFNLPVSFEFLMNLSNQDNAYVEFCLFVANHEVNFCGGAIIMRCGESVHYMWGATDRHFSHLSIGEAIQWAVIEWAVEQGCKKYDLEGITAHQTSGVDRFKIKMGGRVVVNPGIEIYPFLPFSRFFHLIFKWIVWQRMRIK